MSDAIELPPAPPAPDSFYTPEQRALQERHDSKPLADTVVMAIVRDALEEAHVGFIESRDFFFLATVNDRGEPTTSYKGGAPGLVRALDPHTLVFPNYDGNGMFMSMGNVAATAKVGLLFIDMQTPHRVRVQGTASVSADDPELERYPGANMIVRVAVDAVFLNCARYIHKHTRVEASPYVPEGDGSQPYPSWKRIDALQDTLPERDRGRAEAEGGTITFEDYAEKVQSGTS